MVRVCALAAPLCIGMRPHPLSSPPELLKQADMVTASRQRGADLESEFLRLGPDYVRSAGFSPDGERIVSGSTDRTIKIWDASSGMELMTCMGTVILSDRRDSAPTENALSQEVRTRRSRYGN